MVMQSLRRCLHQLNMCSAWLNCVFYASNSTFDLIFKTYCCRLSCITMTDWCLDRLKCGSSRIPKNMALVRNSKSNMAFVRNNQRGLFMTSPNIYIGHKSPKVMIHCISQIIYMVIIQIIRIKHYKCWNLSFFQTRRNTPRLHLSIRKRRSQQRLASR